MICEGIIKRTISALSIMCIFVACDKFDATNIWNKINELDDRVTTLEDNVKKINSELSNLRSLIEAMQKNDMVSKIETLPDGAGYNIIFISGKVISLYNGTDGANGNTPQISIKQDTDGEWYWTVDGDWLIVDGHKMKAVGKDGSDGITPQLKIENGYWYLFNGTDWVKLGKATGENGKNGDTLIKSIVVEDGKVIITLNDEENTVITLRLASEEVPNHDDSEVLPIQDYLVKELCLKYFDMNNDSKFTYGEARSVTNIRDYFKGEAITTFDELQYFTSLNTIGDEAFQNCNKLERIVLPNGLLSIGRDVFTYCTALTEIVLPKSLQSIGQGTFTGCPILTIDLSETIVTTIGDKTFQNCNKLEHITLPSGLLSIGQFAFESCSALSLIDLPQSLQFIGQNAFASCSALTAINLPQSLQVIQIGAFSGCSSINSEVVIPHGVTTINAEVFAGCSSIPSITFHSAISGEIGVRAFYKCSALSAVDLSKTSVTSIGASAFSHCGQLKKIDLPNTVTSIGNCAFYNDSKNYVDCYLPDSISFIGCGAFYGWYFDKNEGYIQFQLPASLIHLGSYSFYHHKIESVKLPASLQEIGKASLYNALAVFFSTENPPVLYDLANGNVTPQEKFFINGDIPANDYPCPFNDRDNITHVYVPKGCYNNYVNYMKKWITWDYNPWTKYLHEYE